MPNPGKSDPWMVLVMAGLDPAIQTPKTRVWMPGSRPGMTARVAINETWFREYVAITSS
jgi:hypothetical protein